MGREGGPARPTVRLEGGAEGGTDRRRHSGFGRAGYGADDDNNNNNNPEWEKEAVWLRTHSTRAAKKQAKVPRHSFRRLKRRKTVGTLANPTPSSLKGQQGLFFVCREEEEEAPARMEEDRKKRAFVTEGRHPTVSLSSSSFSYGTKDKCLLSTSREGTFCAPFSSISLLVSPPNFPPSCVQYLTPRTE